MSYRGRIAPSPTGYLHLGHARTFWFAQERARRAEGQIILRVEDIDGPRCRPEFVEAIGEDLRWVGLDWDEGPDVGGPHAPYCQSQRYTDYQAAMLRLLNLGLLYPCYCSRRDIREAASAPHEGEDEIIYPGTCRPTAGTASPRPMSSWEQFQEELNDERNGRKPCWRFRVPAGDVISFEDGRCGERSYTANRHFGDFVLWRQDGIVSYQLACVVDDAAMEITEVVRGEDLLVSTARQILLHRALGQSIPSWYHCGLLLDEEGNRLAKRSVAASLRELRASDADPAGWVARWREEYINGDD